MLLQAVGIGHGFRQDLEFVFGLRFLSVEFEGFVEGPDVGTDEVVFDEHAVLDDDRRHFFQVVDHFREENEFFPAMMMAIGIAADEIEDFREFFLIDFSSFEDAAANFFDDFQHAGNIGMLFDHNFCTVHDVLSPFVFTQLF